MAHGTPLGVGDNDERYGVQGAFLIEAGISSSYHIANFFGLTEWIRQPTEQAAKTIQATAPVVSGAPDLTKVFWPLTTLHRHPEPPPQPRRRGIDVGAVIARALTAAGLMK
jgi:hypothetical protein